MYNANVQEKIRQAGFDYKKFIQNPYVEQTVTFFNENGQRKGKIISRVDTTNDYIVEVEGVGGGKFKVCNEQMFQ